MTGASSRDLGRELDRLFREGSLSGASDARLLERFVTEGDAQAFEALVARHREMLLRTCHDLLGDAADAEEAFQATVVILMRRADSIRQKDAIGGWLHRVACRVARRIRANSARRRTIEGQAVAIKTQESIPRSGADPLVQNELRSALHDEIDCLPERYRRPVILCLLEEMTHADAAARLGWTEGSVRGRLARAKARLRDRLKRRGFAPFAILAALADHGPAVVRPLVAVLRMKAVAMAFSVLLALGGAMLAIAALANDPKKPIAGASTVSTQPAPILKANANPEPESLASFRGGGPTNQSRAAALAPEVAARPVDFRGRVVDPAGKGVVGARLTLITDAWSVPELQTSSGTDGSFRFEKTVGDFWRNFAEGGVATPHVQAVVLATHDAFGAAWVNLRVVAKDGKPALGGEYPLSLQMVADRPIEGRLVDEQGGPIAGAVVRVDQLYAVPSGDLSPIIDALRRFDLEPYQTSHPRVWPNNLAAAMAIPPVTTGADGRFVLKGVGRDRQANLSAIGPRMSAMSWTVLNRDEAIEVTKAVRARWPHTSKPAGQTPAQAALNSDAGVDVYGSAFDLKVDRAATIAGVVRDALTGRPVQGALVYTGSLFAPASSATTDELGHYRMERHDGMNHILLSVRPPEGERLLGAAREYDNVQGFSELIADFTLARGVVVSGRAVERGTGQPMLAAQNQGCHGPGPIMGGRVWYRPLFGKAALTGNESELYLRHALQDPLGLFPFGLFVGLVGGDGVFRGTVPPGPGVLLLEAAPGMPFMSESLLPWKERDGYHRRFRYARLTQRDPADGAPRAPGEAVNTLPGAYGPISLEGVVAYRVIDAPVNDAPYKVEVTIPTALSRRVRFVDPDGRPVRGLVVSGLTACAEHRVVLDGDETEVLALDPTRTRWLTAQTADGQLSVETTLRADSDEVLTVRMRRAGP